MEGLSIEQIITTLGYIGIFSLMIINGIASFPSSQILYIISGYFIFTGDLNLILAAIAGALGNTIGNIVLYKIVEKKGLHYITKFSIFRESDIKKVQIVFRKKGSWFLFFGKLVPALKVLMPVVAAVGKMRFRLYVPIIFISSTVWALFFIGIGYFFGKNIDFFGRYALILIFVAFLLLSVFYKYMNSKSILDELEICDED